MKSFQYRWSNYQNETGRPYQDTYTQGKGFWSMRASLILVWLLWVYLKLPIRENLKEPPLLQGFWALWKTRQKVTSPFFHTSKKHRSYNPISIHISIPLVRIASKVTAHQFIQTLFFINSLIYKIYAGSVLCLSRHNWSHSASQGYAPDENAEKKKNMQIYPLTKPLD